MKISDSKKERISEQILSLLYTSAPKPVFTAAIAKEIARDEEFIKNLMMELKKKNLVVEINKNSAGKSYSRRKRWALSEGAYNSYRKITGST